MTTSSKTVKVCVCGGGPTGLAAAIGLARHPNDANQEEVYAAGTVFEVTVVDPLGPPAEREQVTAKSYPIDIRSVFRCPPSRSSRQFPWQTRTQFTSCSDSTS